MIEITQRGEKQAETRAVFVSVSQGVKQKLTVVFERCEEGGFHAFIKEIAGVHSEGETIREATDNLMDALHELLCYRIEQELKEKDSSSINHFEAELVS
jgi:predicted RNase H-like HicB family nuclease